MGWEKRGGGRYYYQKERQGGRVVSRYVGAGGLGELLAQADRLERWERVKDQLQDRAAREQQERHERQLRPYYDLVRVVVRAALVEAGCYRHKGQWRKAGMGTLTEAPKEERERVFAALRAVSKKGAAAADIKTFEQALSTYPELWRVLGNLSGMAITQMLQLQDQAPGITASISTGISRMKDDLGYAEAGPLEQLLIDQIGVAWLDYSLTQMTYAQATSGSHALTKGAYWDRRVTAAQSRYLRAVETLARVRKLNINIQVNIAGPGGQQVNVNGG